MFTRSVVAWIVNACCVLRRSQAKTVAQIVKGAMRCRRVSQAEIGRYKVLKAAVPIRGRARYRARPRPAAIAAGKNIRYGWGLRQLKIGTAGRLERLLLVLAFAYLLLLLIGLVCRDIMSEAHWASATTKTQDQACGLTVGRYMLDREKWRLKALFEAFARILTGWVEENWG